MANTGRLVSLKMVASRLMQNPLMKDLSWEFIIDKSVELMNILEAPAIYIEKREVMTVYQYKASMPLDLMKVIAVYKQENDNDGQLYPMRVGTDTLHNFYNDFPSAATGATTTALSSSRTSTESSATGSGYTYQAKGNHIYTNFEEGKILVVYKTIATDSECYPMVLDNAVLLRCIESYIKYRWFDILNDMDQISDRKLNKAEVDYSANVAQADANLKMPTDDEMESLVNQITTLIPPRRQFEERFQYLGAQEHLRIQ